ncbi:hypothetical protein K9N08_00740, partial [Candidatus Gracilibacteria bacterium]|nr:hypothetical protein [Candidatus Gracilibacteria bacterium]MCF7856070.1 hypothetical protein [Candidatus Gracilibacteria bacterium]MCF7896375.1 hypothetical protein [Candidatus Gracilibacteria bacterium]
MKLRINSIFTLTILAVVLSTSSQVFAGWGAEGYSIFNTGETPITAPVGINIHYAQNNNGVKDTQTYYYDPDVPTLVSGQEKILMANHVAPIIINFSDTENTIPVGAATSEIKTLNLKIKNASGSTISYSFSNTATAIIPQHDFGKAGYYNLQWQAIDNATNDTGWETEVNFFHVVANVPEWTDTNCLANYQTSCPSTITPSSGTQISDGVSFHTVTAKLVDRYGNRVVSESGTKTVKVNFNFNNTTKLDQIAGTGDSARYESSEFSFNKNPGGNNTNWLTKAVGGDGEFELEIASYAPTSAGYTPISSDSFNLDFTSIDYSITYSNPPNLGNTAVNVPALTMFAFAPTLTALPEAMNYNGTNYIVPTDYSALQNITVNAPKRFRTRLNNASASANASALELGLLVEASETNVIWDTDTASIETPSVEDLTLDTAAPFNGIVANWNDVSSVVTNVTAGNSNDLRLKITPKLAAGTAVPEYFDTLLVNYVGYDVGTSGKHVRHKSETLDTSGVSSSLFNPGIEIIGSVKSDAGTSSKQTDAALNKSFGDIAQSEFKNAIGPNILTLTKNPASNVCDSDVTISTTIELTNLSCKNNEGSIFYFKNADVVLGDGVSPIALPSGAKTILIENGDLHIKSNLTYPVGNSNSFGVIILNGNIFIYPGVTNVVGAY